MARLSARARRLREAREILEAVGLPPEQHNERAAVTLLALLSLPPHGAWSSATDPMMGVTPIIEFAGAEYGVR